MPRQDHAIEIVRSFDASADDLYAAWTDPAVMARWMAARVAADVRIGGQYRTEIDAGNGDTYVHRGEYLVLEPGRRVVQTFEAGPSGAEPPAANPHTGEFLAVDLRPLAPDRTELTFTNGWNGAGLNDDDLAATRAAWSSWLDRLEDHLRGQT